ncbi:translation initiation factor IF-2 [Henriciella sp.]|uniref:translation initiation factor IF-2 n=1 Tax=Henriciella sp. TaxID=1968823 RepID=UPI002620A47F|nr:translation initiation factor IF-2 [Henriciella sp.]
MSDTKDNGNTGGRKPLTVSRGSSGTVKQSFSHGRSKQVIVQTKKRRVVGPGGSGQGGGKQPPASSSGASSGGKQQSKLAEAAKKLGITEEELVARQKVLLQRRDAEQQREAEKKRQEAARERLLSEQERKVQEDKEREEAEARRKAEEEERKAKEEAEAKKKKDGPPRDDRGAKPAPGAAPAPDMPIPEPAQSRGGGKKSRKGRQNDRDFDDSAAGGKGGGNKRRKGKLTIASALGDDGDRQRSLASVRRARERERERRQSGGEEREKVSREVTLPESITLQDLAQRMNERVADVVKYMMRQGEMMRANDIVDADTAELITEEFGHTVKRVSEADVEIGLEGDEDDPKDMKPRAPIVTVMGHVDHGKTSLLDAMRSTDIVAGEAGGITQHIGAYQVQLPSDDKITFLDTPGHAAFSSMRARGANVTDIVILVVAADDGVMPQTIEAIKHAKAADVPIIVAVNKCDKPDANPDNVLTELLQHDIQVEAMGGDVQAIKVSATERTGLEELTEAIVLQAELLELKANPNREADGIVVESQLDKGRGPVATVLVNRGTLQRGEIVVAGKQWGKVRALINERGQQLKDAGPAVPVEILGLDGAPEPGDMFNVVDTEARAREITEYRNRAERQKTGVASARASLESLMNSMKDDATVSELPLVVKGDVQGSVEAITQAVEGISTDEVRANVLYGAAGGISESDILLAKSSNAPVFAFNVRANKQARELAEKEGVEIRYYSVIYNLIDDVKDTLSGMLAPEKRETFIGYADILEVFNITKVGKVAGCKVSEGTVKRGCGVRLLRDDVVIHEGKLKTLKRFKDEVAEVTSGMECGMAFEKYEDIREGDKIECFEVEMIDRKLD